MGILILGGGDIATKGIQPVVGGQVVPHDECDVADPQQVERAMSEHKPNVVINCAAVSRPSPVILGALELWRQEIDVNLIGSYYVASSATLAGALIMIFLASIAGLYGKPNHSGYSASKAGVISLVQSLAFEGHHAYAISPGRVDSKMREREYPNEDKETRLQPIEIGWVVRDIIDGRYRPGDNIIIRRIGHRTAPIVVDRSERWTAELKIGAPKTV